MLSREALDIELVDAIRYFSPEEVVLTNLSTVDLLEKLIRLLPDIEPNPAYAVGVMQDRTVILRRLLRVILEKEEEIDEAPEQYCDKVFDLQLTLAKAFPISLIDRVTQENVDTTAPLVFFSNGEVHLKTSAKAFYLQEGCYNSAGEYLDFNNSPMSKREIISLLKQGIRFIEAPSSAERVGKKIGRALGITAIICTYFGMAFFLTLPLLLITLLTGIFSAIASYFSTTLLTTGRAFSVGLAAGVVVLGVLSIAFPPIAGLLVTLGLIGSSTATSACAYFAATVLPMIIAPVLVGVTMITSYITRISIPDVLALTAVLPSMAIVMVIEKVGGFIGRGLNAIGKFLHIIPSSLPQAPVASAEDEAEPQQEPQAQQPEQVVLGSTTGIYILIDAATQNASQEFQAQPDNPQLAPSAPLARAVASVEPVANGIFSGRSTTLGELYAKQQENPPSPKRTG
jgi:hypothetical protein